MTIRVNKDQEHDIFIGRPSIYSNPFVIGIDGSRNEVILKFEKYFKNLNNFHELLDNLENKKIACWCNVDKKCHGDSLIKMLNDRKREIFLEDLFK